MCIKFCPVLCTLCKKEQLTLSVNLWETAGRGSHRFLNQFFCVREDYEVVSPENIASPNHRVTTLVTWTNEATQENIKSRERHY